MGKQSPPLNFPTIRAVAIKKHYFKPLRNTTLKQDEHAYVHAHVSAHVSMCVHCLFLCVC